MKHTSKNILLVNPWITDFVAYDFWLKPLGLLYVGAVLRQHGYNVRLLDCMDRFHQYAPARNKKSRPDGTGKFYKEIIPKPPVLSHVPRRFGRYGIPIQQVQRLLEGMPEPDAVLVTSGMTYWYTGVGEMISMVKSVFPRTPVILGGIYATLCTAHARKGSGADYVVSGPAENVIAGLVNSVTGCSVSPAVYPSIDDLPRPLYSGYQHLPCAAVMTSRGCPYSCPFCASRLLAPAYSRRAPGAVAHEIQHLVMQYGTRHIAFYDDALLLEPGTFLLPLLEELINKKMNVSFHTPNGLQPSRIDHNAAYLMKQAGFQTLRFSYETIDPGWQEIMGKVADCDIESAVSACRSAGFKSSQMGAYIMMGLPGQKARQVVQSILFIIKQGIKVSLASLSPIPGTELFVQMAKDGIIEQNIDPLLTNNSIFPTAGITMQRHEFIALGTLAADANRLINAGIDPIADPCWMRQADSII